MFSATENGKLEEVVSLLGCSGEAVDPRSIIQLLMHQILKELKHDLSVSLFIHTMSPEVLLLLVRTLPAMMFRDEHFDDEKNSLGTSGRSLRHRFSYENFSDEYAIMGPINNTTNEDMATIIGEYSRKIVVFNYIRIDIDSLIRDDKTKYSLDIVKVYGPAGVELLTSPWLLLNASSRASATITALSSTLSSPQLKYIREEGLSPKIKILLHEAIERRFLALDDAYQEFCEEANANAEEQNDDQREHKSIYEGEYGTS